MGRIHNYGKRLKSGRLSSLIQPELSYCAGTWCELPNVHRTLFYHVRRLRQITMAPLPIYVYRNHRLLALWHSQLITTQLDM